MRCSAKRSTASSRRKSIYLLGRKTYEIFAAYWPYDDEAAPHGRIATLFKSLKKYVVSRSGDVDTSWQGSVLLRDITDVKPLRQENGPNLVTKAAPSLCTRCSLTTSLMR